jgi:hypothetical protein
MMMPTQGFSRTFFTFLVIHLRCEGRAALRHKRIIVALPAARKLLS